MEDVCWVLHGGGDGQDGEVVVGAGGWASPQKVIHSGGDGQDCEEVVEGEGG